MWVSKSENSGLTGLYSPAVGDDVKIPSLNVCLLVILSSVALAAPASAQTTGPLDPRSCFSNILVDTTIDKENTDVRYALQQQWSRSLYQEAKQSNSCQRG